MKTPTPSESGCRAEDAIFGDVNNCIPDRKRGILLMKCDFCGGNLEVHYLTLSIDAPDRPDIFDKTWEIKICDFCLRAEFVQLLKEKSLEDLEKYLKRPPIERTCNAPSSEMMKELLRDKKIRNMLKRTPWEEGTEGEEDDFYERAMENARKLSEEIDKINLKEKN